MPILRNDCLAMELLRSRSVGRIRSVPQPIRFSPNGLLIHGLYRHLRHSIIPSQPCFDNQQSSIDHKYLTPNLQHSSMTRLTNNNRLPQPLIRNPRLSLPIILLLPCSFHSIDFILRHQMDRTATPSGSRDSPTV